MPAPAPRPIPKNSRRLNFKTVSPMSFVTSFRKRAGCAILESLNFRIQRRGAEGAPCEYLVKIAGRKKAANRSKSRSGTVSLIGSVGLRGLRCGEGYFDAPWACAAGKTNASNRSSMAGVFNGTYGLFEAVFGFGRLSRLRPVKGLSPQFRSMNLMIETWSEYPCAMCPPCEKGDTISSGIRVPSPKKSTGWM